MLRSVGYPVEHTAEQAWPHYRGWRLNYEDVAYRLAYAIDAPPALWSGTRRLTTPPHQPGQPTVSHPTPSLTTPKSSSATPNNHTRIPFTHTTARRRTRRRSAPRRAASVPRLQSRRVH